MRQAHQIIKRMDLTEKGSRLTEQDNKYLFEASDSANKVEIKRAVESLFKVKVTGVNTLTRLGKAKRNRRGQLGMRSSWKRAIVTLKAGDKIDLT
jgi:large subunit ribosomal protein L23